MIASLGVGAVLCGAAAALTFACSPVGAALTDAAGRLRGANATLARWCACSPQTLVGRRLCDLVDPDDAAAVDAVLDSDAAVRDEAEVRLLIGGQARWVRLLVAPVPAAAASPAAAARPALRVVRVEDATAHRATTARLSHDALHDTLTGLPNRRALAGALAALPAAPGRGGALLMIDLDDFKAVDDRRGHDAGDELLQVAHRLRSCLRPGDVAGRLGGDELLVIARDVTDDDAAEAVSRRVLESPVGPASLRAGVVVPRASIGVRRVTDLDHDALARDADVALYRARRDGGCRVRRAEVGEGDAVGALAAPVAGTG